MDQTTRGLGRMLLHEGVLAIRNVDQGEEPFLYSSGNWGPGYVMVKGLVGKKPILKLLIRALADKLALQIPQVNFIAGNATGGMIPGWLLAEELEIVLRRAIPFVYIRGMRKKGGHKELITGIENNIFIKTGHNAVVVEELVNFAETTCNSARALRETGFTVTDAACILSYENLKARTSLAEEGLRMTYLVSLTEMLDLATEFHTHPIEAITSYREFLDNPDAWQARHGLRQQQV